MEEITEDFYAVISQIISADRTRLSSSYFTDDWKNKLDNSREKELFKLLRKIASLNVEFSNGVADYTSGFLLYGGGETFELSDLNAEDYLLLNNIDLNRIPVLLKARIANVLWNAEKNIVMAKIAIESYYELYHMFYKISKWKSCGEYIKQAINFSIKIGKQELANAYLCELKECVFKNIEKDNIFYVLSTIEFLIENKYETISFLELLNKIVCNTSYNVDEIEKAYYLIIEIYKNNNDFVSAKKTSLALANYYERISEIKDDVRGIFIAEKNLQKAIMIYRNEGKKEESNRVTKKLLEVQNEIPKFMVPITITVDEYETRKEYVSQFDNLNFKEAVIKLIGSVPIITVDGIEKKVLENATNPLACLFGVGIKNAKGQTLITIPPLDVNNPKKDMQVFEMHMNREAIFLAMDYGHVLLWGIQHIKTTYSFTKNDLLFLVDSNSIVPNKRNAIFLSAIYYGLNDELYEALHILAPQMENLFRTIAEDAGCVVSKVNPDCSMEDKLLKSIFDEELLWECYDNDLLFLFRCLLNEKSGANIRNEIAHGIDLTENLFVIVYFYCLVLKLLSFTASHEYKDIERRLDE